MNNTKNIKIFGCKVNKYFADKWYNFLQSQGKRSKDSFLIASCVVTDRAKKKFVKEVVEVIKKHQKKLFLTGCGAFDQGGSVARKKFFELYPALSEFQDSIELLPEDPANPTPKQGGELTAPLKNNGSNSSPVGGGSRRGYTRKFIVIQTGCDSFCTFCLTVHKRGRHKSRSLDCIIDEINNFVDQGGNEIVLTGVNLCAWGATTTTDPKSSQFSFLLQNILKKTTIKRIRISSIGPEFLDEDFFEIVSDDRFLPYFHFSFQSFSDNVLQGMRRNYDCDLLQSHIDKIYKIKGPLTNIGGDIIVGFPGETNEDFQKTFDMIQKNKLTQIHAFPFSPHEIGEKVPAGNFQGQISTEIKKYRMNKLQKLIEKNKSDLIERTVGQKMSILIEQKKNGIRFGWTPNYLQVGLSGKYEPNQIFEKKTSKKDFFIYRKF